MEYGKDISVVETGIPGLALVELPVHGDSRGWFKENWQRQKMVDAGIADERWVQNNISFNASRGVTRGIHAEPWDKWVSVACGSAFGAWVDLREGSPTFGRVFTAELDPSRAIYVPYGVGNSYQALEDGTTYVYLVDAHWTAELKPTYTFVNLGDPELSISWPIPLEQCELSEADRKHPMLADVRPMRPRRTLVTGAHGQLGRAVRAEVEACGILCDFDFTDIGEFDVSNSEAYDSIDWSRYGCVINCGAFTAVDAAETAEGRIAAWKANAVGPVLLARTCAERGITLVHVSTDYVFDGTREVHDEGEAFSPLGVYGQSKAAGDLAVAGCPRHYIVRSSWVVGEGKNFVRTMCELSDRVADSSDGLREISVVYDQVGRLTFASEMARGILWLLGYRPGNVFPSKPAAFGTYNLTCSGKPASWAEVARRTFDLRNANGNAVVAVSTQDYFANAHTPISPRPANSTLELAKIEATGFRSSDWVEMLGEYVASLS